MKIVNFSSKLIRKNMDRIGQLISKLKEEFEENADTSQLLATTQQLEAELRQRSSTVQKSFGTSKVAVVMPTSRQAAHIQHPIAQAQNDREQPVHKYNGRQEAEVVEISREPVIIKNGVEEIKQPEEVLPQEKKEEKQAWEFNPMTEIPTLSHQQSVREINEMMNSNNFSLNDKLKEKVVEVGHILTDAPIRDLKRAIGINDRFVFINELFRGDEVMYERSLKTINGFRIFPEAEYWIERELKVKLGWDDMKDTTRHFYQLVKRRFL